MTEAYFLPFEDDCFLKKDFVSAQNRAFRYGDGFFESILLRNGEIPFLRFHVKRIIHTAAKLRFVLKSDYFSEIFWREKLLAATSDFKNARLRLTVCRGEGGLYLPENRTPSELFLEVKALEKETELLHFVSKKFCFVENIQKDFSPISDLKTLNALIYVLAALETKDRGANEGVIFNSKGEIVECISSNIFLLKDGIFFTPPLQSGCVSGVMRAFLLENAPKYGIKIVEKTLKKADFSTAEAIMTSNAVTGLSVSNAVSFDTSLKERLDAMFADLLS